MSWDALGNETDRLVSRWDRSGTGPVTTGGGPGPWQAPASSPNRLRIGTSVLDVHQYSWQADAVYSNEIPVELQWTQPGAFVVVTDLLQGGGMFADLAATRSLGDIVFEFTTMTDSGTDLLQHAWELEDARVIGYRMLGSGPSGAPTELELTFGFNAIGSEIVNPSPIGTEAEQLNSYWRPGASDPLITGGGAGPAGTRAAFGGNLLQVGNTVLDVLSYDWSAYSTPTPGGDADPTRTQPAPFVITTEFSHGGGLFAELAAGSSLGDVVFVSSDRSTGQLYRAWKLGNARVVHYEVAGEHYETLSEPPLELGLEFDSIELTLVDIDHLGREVGRAVSEWIVYPDPQTPTDPIVATGNVVSGNYIGTNATGTEKKPNANGIEVTSAATDNRIGGTEPGAGNLISGNTAFGVQVSGTSPAKAVRIEGNKIGTDIDGQSAARKRHRLDDRRRQRCDGWRQPAGCG